MLKARNTYTLSDIVEAVVWSGLVWSVIQPLCGPWIRVQESKQNRADRAGDTTSITKPRKEVK